MVNDQNSFGLGRSFSYGSGKWVNPNHLGSYTATSSYAADYIYYMPVYFDQDVTVNAFAVRTTSGNTGDTVVKIGIYDIDPTTGKPLTLLGQSDGELALPGASTYSISPTEVFEVTQGLKYVGVLSDFSGTAASVIIVSPSDCTAMHNRLMGGHDAASDALSGTFCGYRETETYASGLVSTVSEGDLSNNSTGLIPLIAIEVQ